MLGHQLVEMADGLCRGVCKIPANLLNDNKYSVEIYVVKDTSAVLFRQADMVSFEVLDGERHGNWYGKWIGAVRPNLDFSLDKVEN